MGKESILILSAGIFVFLLVIAILVFRYNRIIRRKDDALIKQLNKVDSLLKELEKLSIENEAFERILKLQPPVSKDADKPNTESDTV